MISSVGGSASAKDFIVGGFIRLIWRILRGCGLVDRRERKMEGYGRAFEMEVGVWV